MSEKMQDFWYGMMTAGIIFCLGLALGEEIATRNYEAGSGDSAAITRGVPCCGPGIADHDVSIISPPESGYFEPPPNDRPYRM